MQKQHLELGRAQEKFAIVDRIVWWVEQVFDNLQ